MRLVAMIAILVLSGSAHAQWEIQNSGTTASLRGIHSVGKGIAWASGTNGTVLRTEDGGYLWQRCTIPAGAEKLDFRGIQAFDANTAIVMSSGKGDLSRLYKTTDGCQTWKLVFTNPDSEGFWDAVIARPGEGFIIGDPVDGKFAVFSSSGTSFENWERFGRSCLNCPVFDHRPFKSEAMFAASNSILEGAPSSGIDFVSGGEDGAFFHGTAWGFLKFGHPATDSWTSVLPLVKGPSSGAFSFAVRQDERAKQRHYVVVGGDYSKPNASFQNAAYSDDGGVHWKASTTFPHGYRSAVAYDEKSKTWITVGPNGTDISNDDGKNWRALTPNPSDAPDADKNWNALSLPFVVGSHGRIGVLNPAALQPAALKSK
jgi:hypothetical protein